jgi:hypothetical protein
MSRSTFSGPVVSLGGFISGNANIVPPVTAATLTIPAPTSDNTDIYNGQIIPLSRAAGVTVTLPAATGSMATYRFLTLTTVTSNNNIIKVSNATDVMNGTASGGGATGAVFSTLPASDTITMNGGTTGGFVGSFVEVVDVAAGYWIVTAELLCGATTPATPFSAGV